MKANLHMQRWHQDRPAADSDEGTSLINGILQLDDKFVVNGNVTFHTSGGEIATLTVELHVEDFTVISHNEDDWKQLLIAYDEQLGIR